MQLNNKSLRRDSRGASAIEFAFIVPLLLLIIIGIIEISRNIQFHQKLDAASSQMINIINQNLNLSSESSKAIMESGQEMMKPFSARNMTIYVTAVQQKLAPPELADVVWQVRKLPTDNNVVLPSKIAPSGQGAKIAIPHLTLAQNDQIIVVEVFAAYEPIIDNKITRSILGLGDEANFSYRLAVGRPRFGAFQFDPNCVVGNKVKLNCPTTP